MKEVKPLTLTVGRWLTDADEEADLTFEVFPNLQSVEAYLKWGPGPRQSRSYMMGQDELLSLHEWLGRVLGLEES